MSWLRRLFSDRVSSDAVPVLLAPMAGVNDIAFRQLCVECGVDLTYTEMVSSKALSFANEKTRHLLDRASNESRVAVQLFGHEPDTMAREAAWVEDQMGDALAYIDINMGCPAPKIVKKGDGSALMKTPELACDIVRRVSGAVEHPVTVKFRKGYCAGEDCAVEFARMVEDAGAAAVAVHGRTAAQFYTGTADWDVIARVKHALSIPVIGNGDVKSGSDAVALVQQTGCDAVMIGRAAQGNPWLFSQVKAALCDKEEPAPPSAEQRVAMAHRHAELLSQRMGNNLVYMRKHVMWYLKGIPGAARARGDLNQCVTIEDFDAVLQRLLEDRVRIEAEEAAYLAGDA
ncbi:tRNA dihydrouridine synthase DusB [uncultured Slackia sp.]|uniref:tRNA dihydrouridine synthase DusB n=1 Tax=uncultured Slackia sp. TaxID=665903 RepID=UPI0026164FFF|nr:tRNA dihydrouridine synthase DusB [uncultured Slackia sp.]